MTAYSICGSILLLGGQDDTRTSCGIDSRFPFDDFLAVTTAYTSSGFAANTRDAIPTFVGHVEEYGEF